MGIVPYIMPGFQLAKKAAEVFEQNPKVKGLILLNHGIFTFAENAKMSYELMIKYISLAEKELKQKSKPIRVKKYEEKKISASLIANLIRTLLISTKVSVKVPNKSPPSAEEDSPPIYSLFFSSVTLTPYKAHQCGSKP